MKNPEGIHVEYARPFVKWAGGKGRLIKVLESHLPDGFAQRNDITYVEPFVGGGALLFYMLGHYPNIKRAIINDVNTDLIHCYRLIKERPEALISILHSIQIEYFSIPEAQRCEFYYKQRERYNSTELQEDQRAAVFIFLNHTCFNGLYRENSEGKFNVPFGRMKHPTICDESVIWADHHLLQKVDIYCGNYSLVKSHLKTKNAFVYIDPPYRPLSKTSNFKGYSKERFADKQQEELKLFCDKLGEKGNLVMLSNSFSVNSDGSSYFDLLYEGYEIDKILAHRFINAHIEKRRSKEIELIIKNYQITSTNEEIANL